MPSLADIKLEALFTMLKGEPGTRKSTCALSYPKPQYWFSTDQKMEALKLPANRWGIKPNDIQYDDYTNWDKPRAKMEQFQVNCPFKTLIVDSITSFGDAMTSQVKKNKRADGMGKTIGGIPVSGLEEFNAEASAFQEMIAILKDIQKFHNVNIVLIAHVLGARKDNDANKLTHHSRIIVTGAERIGAKLAAYMTEVYHFNIKPAFDADKEGSYGLMTTHTGNDYARTSLPLPKEIEFNDQPLYDKWIAPSIVKLLAEKPIERIPTPSVTPTNSLTAPSFTK
ncbi:MAG: AAA family ATPase [Paenisporosarcina sp.]